MRASLDRRLCVRDGGNRREGRRGRPGERRDGLDRRQPGVERGDPAERERKMNNKPKQQSADAGRAPVVVLRFIDSCERDGYYS